jgi:hypothetical protein
MFDVRYWLGFNGLTGPLAYGHNIYLCNFQHCLDLLDIKLGNLRFHVSPILVTRWPWPRNLESNVVRHPVNVLIGLDRIIRQLAASVAHWQVLLDVEAPHIVNVESEQTVFAKLAERTN